LGQNIPNGLAAGHHRGVGGLWNGQCILQGARRREADDLLNVEILCRQHQAVIVTVIGPNERVKMSWLAPYPQPATGCGRGSTAAYLGGRIPAMESIHDEASALARQWLEEFEAAARRPLKTRFRYSFIHTYKPVLDDEPYRAFDTMEDYRRWCEANLPDWLGYGRL
jgi:hypothetical protein